MAKKPKNKKSGTPKPAIAAAPASARGKSRAAASASTSNATASTAEESAHRTMQGTGDAHAESPPTASISSDAAQMDHVSDVATMDSASMADGLIDAPLPESGSIDPPDPMHADGDASGADPAAVDPAMTEASEATPAVGTQPSRPLDLVPVEIFDSGVGGGNADDIRGVLIQLANARLLLPNATIAEVLSYAEPDGIEGTPDWLLGRIRWRGWQLPLIAFAQLAGISAERGGLGSKVVVLKALSGSKTPYFAVLTQGFPRLVTVSRAALMVDDTALDMPDGILAHVTLNQDDAYVPDLARIEAMIGEALAQAA